jgi:cation diffusion facilitator CzcD-associated flavoprotein CzcO
MAKYYKLTQSTTFNTYVISATWNEEALMWTVLTEDSKSGVQKIWTTRVV